MYIYIVSVVGCSSRLQHDDEDICDAIQEKVTYVSKKKFTKWRNCRIDPQSQNYSFLFFDRIAIYQLSTSDSTMR